MDGLILTPGKGIFGNIYVTARCSLGTLADGDIVCLAVGDTEEVGLRVRMATSSDAAILGVVYGNSFSLNANSAGKILVYGIHPRLKAVTGVGIVSQNVLIVSGIPGQAEADVGSSKPFIIGSALTDEAGGRCKAFIRCMG